MYICNTCTLERYHAFHAIKSTYNRFQQLELNMYLMYFVCAIYATYHVLVNLLSVRCATMRYKRIYLICILYVCLIINIEVKL